MNKERLLQLADLLDTLPPEKFDYQFYVGKDWDGVSDIISCGTTACGIGWATILPNIPPVKMNRTNAESLRINGKWADDWVSDIFDITFDEISKLFYYLTSGLSKNATAKQLAEHIRKFVGKT